ncbi:MAG: hypothetical protein FWG10_11240 [Eubacteriaceae bacterium]|nr:hypothetical protein [Eubacteriaceae bacterium]
MDKNKKNSLPLDKKTPPQLEAAIPLHTENTSPTMFSQEAQMRKLMSKRFYTNAKLVGGGFKPCACPALLEGLDNGEITRLEPNFPDWDQNERQEDRFNCFRVHMQESIKFKAPYSVILRGFLVRYRVSRSALFFCVDGCDVFSVSEDATIDEMKSFYNMVHSFIRNRIEVFISMPEKEKTAFLLKSYGINTMFAERGRSWISKPGQWVLSQTAMFGQLNRVLLESILAKSWIFTDKEALKTLLCFILGLPHGTIMSLASGLSFYYPQGYFFGTEDEVFSALSDICYFAGFANRKTLLHRFYKSNARADGIIDLSFDYPFRWGVQMNFMVRMASKQKLVVENHISFVSARWEGRKKVGIEENLLLVSKCQF